MRSYLEAHINLVYLMNDTINVINVVDTNSLANGTPKVYMISDHSGDKSEGTPELQIIAMVGDYIHWRAIAVNLKDDVEIINFSKKSGDPCMEAPFMTALGWTSEVVATGVEDYTITFSVDGQGIFTWDPRIIIIPKP